MKISSSAFEHNGDIPKKYTCQGDNVNPSLLFSDIPKETKSLVLIMDDPDTAMGTFVHWVLYNIGSNEQGISENSVPSGSLSGSNGAGSQKFIGACPPTGKHRYFFKLYALNTMLNFNSIPDKKAVEQAMTNHILEKAELVGLYQKK